MNKLPPSNLPPLSMPWGRAIEQIEVDHEAALGGLRQQLDTANRTITTQLTENIEMQNYIRILCSLVGSPYPPVEAAPTPPPTPPPGPVAPVPVTKDFAATWSATWYQGYKRTSAGGTNDDRNSLYQRGTGYTYSMWRFDIGDARGRQITAASMFLSNISTYYNGSFVAALGTHANVGEPAARQSRVNPFDVGWTAGESKWVPLPEWMLPALSNGSIQGFTMGDNVADRQNFARFNGVGRSGAPILKLTYNT